MASLMRSVVSKKKNRFTEDGFNLDLTYITSQIVAMGFPSVGNEALYRNPLPEVQRFFTTRHANHYKIYNLCSERGYEEDCFEKCERFPFDDHNPSALDMIGRFCSSVERFLLNDPQSVVAIHCKAGKGRTGMMIACVLLHLGICKTADAALELFGSMRTSNKKGVTIPSQIRYVYYYEQLLRRPDVTSNAYKITHIRLTTVPNFDPSITGGGCDPYFHIRLLQKASDSTWKERRVFNFKAAVKGNVQKCHPHEKFVDIDCRHLNCKVKGDVKLCFFDHDQYSKDDKMFHLWFHTAFVERNFLVFEKIVVDKACKDKHCRTFDAGFKVEVYLHRIDDKEFDIETLQDEGDTRSDTDEDDDDEEEA